MLAGGKFFGKSVLSVRDVPKPVFVLLVAVRLDPEGSVTVQVNV